MTVQPQKRCHLVSPLPPQYGMVFDAGSTHTALYIYQWPANKENGTGIVSQVETCTVNGECARTGLPLCPASALPGDAAADGPWCLTVVAVVGRAR